MPNVTNQNLHIVLPSLINIIRGQAMSAKVTLHKNFVGNPLIVGQLSECVVEYIDVNNQVFKTQSIGANNLIFGNVTGEKANEISIELTAGETAGLAFSANNINGELFVRFKITEGISEVLMPKLKIGNVYDAGDQIGDIVASRFTVPSTVYKVKHLGSAQYNSMMPAQGELVFNSEVPSQISKVKVANKDDKGYKNEWLETLLINRIGVDGLTNSIFFTNVNNTSEYSLFRISGWQRVDVSIPDPSNPNNAELDDAIELNLIFEGNSAEPGGTYTLAVGDQLGIFTESYQGLHAQGITITTPDIPGGVDGIRDLTFAGASISSTVGALPTDGEMTITVAPGQKGEKGEVGDKGDQGDQGIQGDKGDQGDKGETGIQGDKGDKGDTGAKGDEGDTAYEVYANSMANPLGETDWLNSLVGQTGAKGDTGDKGEIGEGQKGEPGTNGEKGATGDKGDTGADSTVAGPKGDTGAKGDEGGVGAKGDQGEQGEQGAGGTVGGPGPKGDTGEKGETGADSTVAGPKGEPGEKGATGDAGGTGTKGEPGSPGADGNDGNPGTAGDKGEPGEKGAPGDAGGTGLKGEPGADSTVAGPKGDKGEPGSDGTPGTAGDKGEPGVGNTGQKGEPGADGNDSTVAGPKGEPGEKGADGADGNDSTVAGPKGEPGADSNVAGPKGEPGEKGAQGDEGTAGDKGEVGEKGAQGDQGNPGTPGTAGDKGEPGADGNDSTVAGPKGEPGEKGDQGAEGAASTVAGPKGEPGADSTVAGPKGDTGAKGDQGDPGEKGAPGDKGDTGTNGTNGDKGEVGEKGAQGDKGETGADSTVAGPKGDTGAKGDQGDKGEQGGVGPGITFKGDVATEGDLPGGASAGDAYIVQFDDSMHIWDGSAWVDGGSIQGPTGPQGQKGETGADSTVAGPKGDAGDKGDTGGQGDKGATGEKGAPGNDSTVAGPKGDTGETGQKGQTGEKGEVGNDSTVAGPKGDAGDKGDAGEKGDAGDKGDAGANGGGVPAGGTTGQALLKQSNTDQDLYWGNVASSGGGNLYFARAEYNSSQLLAGVEFLDPSGNGDFLTSGAAVGTIAGNNVDLTFSNETTPPKEIIAYGYQANNSRYVITQLDGGGNNAAFYAQGATESAHSSSFGVGNQVTTDIMTNFGSAKLTLDISMPNLDVVRSAGGFGSDTKEGHAFIVFRF